jgi:hypothetical protein
LKAFRLVLEQTTFLFRENNKEDELKDCKANERSKPLKDLGSCSITDK